MESNERVERVVAEFQVALKTMGIPVIIGILKADSCISLLAAYLKGAATALTAEEYEEVLKSDDLARHINDELGVL